MWQGDFSKQLLDRLEPNLLHLVDPWAFTGDPSHSRAWYGGSKAADQEQMDHVFEGVIRRFAGDMARRRVRLHRLASLEAADLFADQSVDWVYIDGDHLYEAVRADLRAWWPKVKAGGLLVGDDYGVQGWWGDGVTRAANEFIAATDCSVLGLKAGQFVLRKRGPDPVPSPNRPVESASPRATPGVSIAVVGLPKTGTSALYASIKESGNFLSIYEVGTQRQIDYLEQHSERSRLAKILIPKLFEFRTDLSPFQRSVLIVRDPRDVVVSWLLFRPFLHRTWQHDAFIQDLLTMLQRKESDPTAVSISQLQDLYTRHGVPFTRARDYTAWFGQEALLRSREPDMAILRYEDFLAGDIQQIEEHLGVPIAQEARLGSYNAFNERAKVAGGWRSWFTHEDLATYRPVFDGYLASYGYDPDWSVGDAGPIDAETSSQHIRRHVEHLRRQPPSTGELREPGAYTDELIQELHSATADGREPSMIELALVFRDGLGVPRDLDQMASVLTDAAARGNPLALIHLGLAYRYGVGFPKSEHLAHISLSSVAAIRNNRRAKGMINRHSPAWSAHAN